MRWKTAQRHHKIKKKTKLALLVLAGLLGLILVSQLITFVKVLTRPYNLIAFDRHYTWNGEFNLNFVANTNPISLISYSPEEKRVTILTIPDNTLIDVPGGFGRWQARSIYSLGGESLVKTSISQFFGIPVDGFSSHNLVDHLRGNLASGIEILSKLKTDFTPLELIRLKANLLGIRFDKIHQLNLEEHTILEREKLADGTEVFIADPIRLDSIIADLADPKIKREHLSITIFNATDKPLIAAKAKRLITNMGGNVIVTQNAPSKIAKTYVEGEKSKTLERLTQIFDSCGKMCDKIPKEDLGISAARAQIILVLGQDFL